MGYQQNLKAFFPRLFPVGFHVVVACALAVGMVTHLCGHDHSLSLMYWLVHFRSAIQDKLTAKFAGIFNAPREQLNCSQMRSCIGKIGSVGLVVPVVHIKIKSA